MTTYHFIRHLDARSIPIDDFPKIHLVVTSPPYPMIQMWDDIFCEMNPQIKDELKKNPIMAFELMHLELDQVWKTIDPLLVDGGIVCINIGDATRKFDGNFQLFPSHARIIKTFMEMGYLNLPSIIWKKPTNSPTKFMGSGTLPPNAYVTLEHEHILIFRKGGMRKNINIAQRKSSSFFWEERNQWFSDIWELTGTRQPMAEGSRTRSAAFPFEVPYRLIQMYSIKNDWVLDPFLGTGTTTMAAIASERNSIGFELDLELVESISKRIVSIAPMLNDYIKSRLKTHEEFIRKYSEKKQPKYQNSAGFPVITKQEIELKLNLIKSINRDNNKIVVDYL
ncbi:MAG: site-specific DNA-methyltransferase [Methanobacteriota archaeon]|nr:MAG: site-specific DNA-methyltransferase [Euryarchaeota archaeon]